MEIRKKKKRNRKSTEGVLVARKGLLHDNFLVNLSKFGSSPVFLLLEWQIMRGYYSISHLKNKQMYRIDKQEPFSTQLSSYSLLRTNLSGEGSIEN